MNERNLNEKESLELIARMITNTQQNFGVGSGNPFLVWGVSTLLTSIAVLIINAMTGNPYSNFAWFLIPIIGYAWSATLVKRERVITHIDKLVGKIWLVCGALCTLIPVVLSLLHFLACDNLTLKSGAVLSIIPFVEIIIVSLGISITGVVINYKSITLAGLIGMAISFLTLLNFQHIFTLTFAIWAIVCMIIPGILLNNKAKSSK